MAETSGRLMSRGYSNPWRRVRSRLCLIRLDLRRQDRARLYHITLNPLRRDRARLCHIVPGKATARRIMSHSPAEGDRAPDYVTFLCGRRPSEQKSAPSRPVFEKRMPSGVTRHLSTILVECSFQPDLRSRIQFSTIRVESIATSPNRSNSSGRKFPRT